MYIDVILLIVIFISYLECTIVPHVRVLNGSGRPDKPDGTRGFGPGSGRKYKQMTRVGSDLGLNLFHPVKKQTNYYNHHCCSP